MKALLPQIVDSLAPLLVAVLVFLFSRLSLAIQAKVKSERLRTVALTLTEVASDVVLEMEQNIVSKLRRSSTDGRIDADEIADLKRIALGSFKQYLGTNGKAAALKAFGFAHEEELDAMLSSKLEAEVAKMRVAQSASVVVNTTANTAV